MLSRVIEVAKAAAQDDENISIFVATDNREIQEHALKCGVGAIITPVSCKNGSERVLSALRQMEDWPDFVINLQGDAPFTPPETLRLLIGAFAKDQSIEVVTPVRKLSWKDLDSLRESKKTSPFSGTSAIINKNGKALWFSKNIIPAIRNEGQLRENGAECPILQHMGLYGFRPDILERFCSLEETDYERAEGLEQLRLLEDGIRIQTVIAPSDEHNLQGGIDTPQDLARAEHALQFIDK